VALLLLMFSMTAMAVKTVHYNPFADTAQEADRELGAAIEDGARVVAEASAAVAAFETTNRRLRGVLDDLSASAVGRLDAAWTAILRDRHQHGLAGTIAPPFAVNDVATDGPRVRHPLFDRVPEPAVWLGPVHEGRTMLRDEAVHEDGVRLRALLADLADQRAVAAEDEEKADA
jgi:hypothetical protein